MVIVRDEIPPLPPGRDSHKALLERTATEVPGKRHALWRTTAFEDLDELLRFRHFFRTPHAADLDRLKLPAVADRAPAAAPYVEADVLSFRDGLER